MYTPIIMHTNAISNDIVILIQRRRNFTSRSNTLQFKRDTRAYAPVFSILYTLFVRDSNVICMAQGVFSMVENYLRIRIQLIQSCLLFAKVFINSIEVRLGYLDQLVSISNMISRTGYAFARLLRKKPK